MARPLGRGTTGTQSLFACAVAATTARLWRTGSPVTALAAAAAFVTMPRLAHWAVLVVVRATPWAPPHDAERLFLPSFAFLALLAGLGADALWRRRGARVKDGRDATVDLCHGVPLLQEVPQLELEVVEFARIRAAEGMRRPEFLRVQLQAASEPMA